MIRPAPSNFFFFFNDTATTEIYTLSLHDALPIYPNEILNLKKKAEIDSKASYRLYEYYTLSEYNEEESRSEEHTSELQSPCNLVCRLLLEKKKAYPWRFILTRCSRTSRSWKISCS